MKPLLVLLLLAFSITSQADLCEHEPALCQAEQDYSEADGELNRIYKAIMGKIWADEFADYLVDSTALRHSLRQGQRAWIDYRDQHCEAYYTLLSGGTSRNTDRLHCLAHMTRQRSQTLQQLYLEGADYSQ